MKSVAFIPIAFLTCSAFPTRKGGRKWHRKPENLEDAKKLRRRFMKVPDVKDVGLLVKGGGYYDKKEEAYDPAAYGMEDASYEDKDERRLAGMSGSCPAEDFVTCVDGYATMVGGNATVGTVTCQEACNGRCCVGNGTAFGQPYNSCTGFNGKVCKSKSGDIPACSDNRTIGSRIGRACYKANIAEVVNGCYGRKACEKAGYNGGYLGRVVNSCKGGDESCIFAAYGGYIKEIVDSCIGEDVCWNTAANDGKIISITNGSCVRGVGLEIGFGSCAYAANEGYIGYINHGCRGVGSCNSAAYKRSIDGISYACNNINACFYLACGGWVTSANPNYDSVNSAVVSCCNSESECTGEVVDSDGLPVTCEGISASPTSSPTNTPTTSNPTGSPITMPPSVSPTHTPTTAQPSASPTHMPTTASPSSPPSVNPSQQPTVTPSSSPSVNPSQQPTTEAPTVSPTHAPTTASPSSPPSVNPSQQPTVTPSSSPSVNPSQQPTTEAPTVSPTHTPTTAFPSLSPTHTPTSASPSSSPSVNPSQQPTTEAPTVAPSTNPTDSPVLLASPTSSPQALTLAPTTSPTALVPEVTQSLNNTLSVNIGNSTNTTNTTSAIIPEARYLRGLREFACAPDGTISALEETTKGIVAPALSSDQELKSIDTVACILDGSSLIVTQELEISMTCNLSCEATAADLVSLNLADTISTTLDEAIESNNFTSALQENAAKCKPASQCTDLTLATVDELPTVEAGEVAVITLAPSPSPTKSPVTKPRAESAAPSVGKSSDVSSSPTSAPSSKGEPSDVASASGKSGKSSSAVPGVSKASKKSEASSKSSKSVKSANTEPQENTKLDEVEEVLEESVALGIDEVEEPKESAKFDVDEEEDPEEVTEEEEDEAKEDGVLDMLAKMLGGWW